ncbi:MAG: putative DNA binding domain-containing protein [Ignavibacteria bacterium]|jgi:ATP-dependent DNA helicase RecG
MPEDQNIEYKSTWRDEFLKWICGFANAKGGKLYVGKDDSGNVLGLTNSARLMDDLPNKIRNGLGISPQINLLNENNNDFIEILVEPQTVAISYHGRYYKRIGSTNQVLTGSELTDFLLQKSGRTWDDVVEERAKLDDIDEITLKKFINSSKETNRLPDVDGLSTFEILEKLRLTSGDKLKRAAIILFGKDPNKFYPNVSVKMGLFLRSDDDLVLETYKEGNLFNLLNTAINDVF